MILNAEIGEYSHEKVYSVRLHRQIPPYYPDLHRAQERALWLASCDSAFTHTLITLPFLPFPTHPHSAGELLVTADTPFSTTILCLLFLNTTFLFPTCTVIVLACSLLNPRTSSAQVMSFMNIPFGYGTLLRPWYTSTAKAGILP